MARTPIGMVPQIMDGFIPVYGVAMGTRWTMPKLIEYFRAVSPRRYWPPWMLREETSR